MSTFTVGNLRYQTTSATECKVFQVVNQNIVDASLQIPLTASDGTTTYQVTSIGESALQNLNRLLSVEIGANIKSIDKNGFTNCTNLSNVVLGPNVQTIGNNAFYNCPGLTSITFPPSVTFIDNGAFVSTGLTNLVIPSTVKTIVGYAFGYISTLNTVHIGAGSADVSGTDVDAFAFVDSILTSVIIGPGVKSIGNNAFIRTGVTQVTWNTNKANSVTNNYGFYGANTVTTLIVGNSVTQILNSFQINDTLVNLTIGSSVTSIGNNVFNNCPNLTNVEFLGTVIPTIGTGNFSPKVNAGHYNKRVTIADVNRLSLYFVNLIREGDYPCFKEGTLILTNRGYLPIQTLRPGDLIKTSKNGYKPIHMIGFRELHHRSRKQRIQDQLYKCSQSEYPELFEDLILTGCHSILVDDFVNDDQRETTRSVLGKIYVTDNKYRLPACVDARASVYETPGKYSIYHVALEHDDYYMNYGIYANGLLVESCSKRYLKELSNMELIE